MTDDMMNKIWTVSGKMIDPANPDPALIDLDDIATGAANICRFGGQVPVDKRYSVGEHMLLACYVAPDEYRLEAFMHDMAEPYVGDVISPIKRLLPAFRAIERRMLKAVYEGLGVEWVEPSLTVAVIDANIMAAESIFHRVQPMPISDEPMFLRAMTWLRTNEQSKRECGGWDIKARFIRRFYDLKP